MVFKRALCTYKTLCLAVTVNIVIARYTENFIVRKIDSSCKLVNKSLNEYVLVFLARESKIACSQHKIKRDSLRNASLDIIKHSNKNCVLRPDFTFT